MRLVVGMIVRMGMGMRIGKRVVIVVIRLTFRFLFLRTDKYDDLRNVDGRVYGRGRADERNVGGRVGDYFDHHYGRDRCPSFASVPELACRYIY